MYIVGRSMYNTYVCVCICVRMHVCMYVCMIFMYVCMYVWKHSTWRASIDIGVTVISRRSTNKIIKRLAVSKACQTPWILTCCLSIIIIVGPSTWDELP